MDKLIVWSLFDDDQSCYNQAIEKYFNDKIVNYSIGINNRQHINNFIKLDLSCYDTLFGLNTLFDTLDKLPKPDIILASPPCTSWSIATNWWGGNIFYHKETLNTLMGKIETENEFIPSGYQRIQEYNSVKSHKQKIDKNIYNRVNGELTALNTYKIINHYKPKVFVIENPQGSKLFKWYNYTLDFKSYHNKAYYYNYDDNFSMKPSIFMSNIQMQLKAFRQNSKYVIGKGRKESQRKLREKEYKQVQNKDRSKIPLLLIKDILEQCINYIKGATNE